MRSLQTKQPNTARERYATNSLGRLVYALEVVTSAITASRWWLRYMVRITGCGCCCRFAVKTTKSNCDASAGQPYAARAAASESCAPRCCGSSGSRAACWRLSTGLSTGCAPGRLLVVVAPRWGCASACLSARALVRLRAGRRRAGVWC